MLTPVHFPLSLFPSLFYLLLSLLLLLLLLTFMSQSFPQVMSDGGEIYLTSTLPSCHSGCQRLLRPSTLCTRCNFWKLCETDEGEEGGEAGEGGGIERDSGIDTEGERHLKERKGDRGESPRQLK